MEQVTVEKCGNEQWPRFVVKDASERYWTGEGWSDELSVLLFVEQHQAMRTALELTLGSKLRLFTTTATVIVEGNEPITVEQLRRFLNSNCNVWLGNDGADEAFENLRLNVDVEWSDLEESE